ncbi:MAG: tetratricopeptide repeat protein [Polyangiaceae bacterium]|nr:tetratricopeptide repeat protein [Polyangiaceae bacterium]
MMLRSSLHSWVLVVAGASALSGCATRAEFRKLEQESRAREQRLAAVEEQLSTQRADLEGVTARAQERVQELQQILEQATQAVTRNSADVVTEVERIRADLGALEGRVAEVRNETTTGNAALRQRVAELDQQIDRIAAQTGIELAIAESEIPPDANAHFAAAKQAYDANDFPRARGLFRVFTTRHPRHEKADDAYYYIGKSFMAQDRPQSAISPFQRVIQDYRTGDMIDDTLLAMGDAFFQLRACGDARTAYDALVQGHRNSPHVAAARRGLENVRRATRAQCTP